ncbi:FtsX-like permease family protein [Streptomyces catenulae]|uniref:FtsX-like permease family protein n=1 Tax=Streptomyces catenulae TaxID=66875 RepID=A0ABV2YYA7_9ACTN|nr:FtsX-like permease family protein [Streptomyces catenulae]
MNRTAARHPAHGPAVVLGVLVLLTAFLAAAFVGGVDAYETRGARAALATAPAEQRALQISLSRTDTTEPGTDFAPRRTDREDRALRRTLGIPLAPGDAVHGVRTTVPLTTPDPKLPRPDGAPAAFTLYAPAGLDDHATPTEGRLPRAAAPGAEVLEAAVTTATARTLHLRPGDTLHPGTLTVRITGLLTPRAATGAYWSLDDLLTAPHLAPTDGVPPLRAWRGALLLAPGDGPALTAEDRGAAEKFWWYGLDARPLTARQVPALRTRLASLEHGTALAAVRAVTGPDTVVDTAADSLLAGYARSRAALTPVLAVAACTVATTAAVVLVMAGALAAARRHDEFALLRARGASLPGLAGRLAAGTCAVALPAAAAGWGAARLLVPGSPGAPATGPLLAATAVAVVGAAVLPLRAAHVHRRPHPTARHDTATARPSRRRAVAELTTVALAAAAVTALRRHGPADGPDLLVSAAPVLIAVIATLLLLRLHPLPLRALARPAARRRGLTGFLALARAGRARTATGLPLLALLTALTCASFGGAVLSGVGHGRDAAALATVGAEARITSDRPLPPALRTALTKVPGVTDAVPVRTEVQPAPDNGPPLTLVVADADAYARLSRATGLGAFAPTTLAEPGGDAPLPALVSPDVVRRFGHDPMPLQPEAGSLVVRPAAVRADTPALPGGDFLVVAADAVHHRHPDADASPTALLLSGTSPDPAALRAAVRAHTPPGAHPVTVIRGEVRARLADAPLQQGAERLYAAATAAGAGYALLALVLAGLRAAPDRAPLLGRLRALGMSRRQGRRLLLLEALPQALLAAVGGAATAAVTLWLLGPATDLTPLALPGGASGTVPLRSGGATLLLPSAGVLVLTLAAALAQTWSAGRRQSPDRRAGDL